MGGFQLGKVNVLGSKSTSDETRVGKDPFAVASSSVMGGFHPCNKYFPPLNSEKIVWEKLPFSIAAQEEDGALASNMSVPQHTQWSSRFGSSSTPTLRFHEPIVCNGKKTAQISRFVHEQGLAIRQDSPIGQFYGPAPPRNQIQAVVSRL